MHPNIGASQYVRQMLTSMKGKINTNTIIMVDFITLLKPMDRSIKQKISKETQPLNDTMGQLDLIDIYRPFHLKTTEFTFFPNAHRTFSWAINPALLNSKNLKSFQASFPVTMQ